MKITEENYVDEAERVIKLIKNEKDDRGRQCPQITTSQIRNLLAMSADIHNELMRQNDDTIPEEICSRIEYLRVRFIYECGRTPSVKIFVEKSDLINIIKNIGKSKKKFELFNRYMESLVAYHRYYGGRD